MALKKYITLEHLTTAVSALLNKIAEKANIADLSDVAFSGSYTDLENKPDLTQYVSYNAVEDMVDGTIDGPFMIKGKDYVTAGQLSGQTLGDYATAEGYETISSGDYSHAEGYSTQASGDDSHAEGNNTSANGLYSHAEGSSTSAYGTASHTEGSMTIASGNYSHAEGHYTVANGNYSHAEGYHSSTYGDESHAEGRGLTFTVSLNVPNGTTYSISSGWPSDVYQNCPAKITGETAEITGFGVSEGKISSITFNQALENNQTYRALQFYGTRDAQSHSEGLGTIACDIAQHAGGKYNIPISGAEVIGGGTSSTPANIRTLDWSGNETLAGKLTVGANPVNNMDVVTKQYMESKGYLTLATLPVYDGTVVNGGGQA